MHYKLLKEKKPIYAYNWPRTLVLHPIPLNCPLIYKQVMPRLVMQ